MSTMSIVMIISIIIIFVIIGVTVLVTNKAYEVLPSVNKVDPLPEEFINQNENDNEQEKEQ